MKEPLGKLLNRIYTFRNLLKFYILCRPFLNKCGNNSFISAPLFISFENISIGNNVYIAANARLETIQNWNNIKYTPKIQIEDNVTIEQNMHLICAGNIVIGSGTTISSNVFISDVNHDYRFKELRKITYNNLVYKKTIIGKNCFIGTGAVILPGTVLGDGTIVGANSVLSGVYKSYSVVVGAPGRTIKYYE